jgi:hypothetical protein
MDFSRPDKADAPALNAILWQNAHINRAQFKPTAAARRLAQNK